MLRPVRDLPESTGHQRRNQLAIELDEMESTVTPVSSGMEIHAHVKIVIVYGRQADGEWKIVRLMELLD